MAHPHMEYDPEGPIKRLREMCLALPEATEKEAWGECTFRVGGKMFAMTDNHHHGSAHCSVWVTPSGSSSRRTSGTRDGSASAST
jgi:predicted DNA-binding protein (MmcQ/YjbR family)